MDNKTIRAAIFITILMMNAFAFNTNAQLLPGKSKAALDTTFTVTIDVNKTAQTIDNIGASGCWFSEGIGKYWPSAKKERIAELLFSRAFDKQGNPNGIGLSAWRFNIGAGTFEQGDSSGIKDFRKRTECFLKPDGTCDWNKQAGYQYFVKKAHQYGVETLIAFSNSPPVQFTKNGLGYKTEKDYKANLKDDQYGAYARFLASTIKHFDEQGLHFKYISPVNEPQWDWSHKYMEADQEGSPWKNEEIFKVTKLLDEALTDARLDSKILVTEAGMLNYLYGGKTVASHQIQDFFNPKSNLYIGMMSHVPKLIGGHSYYTESNDSSRLAVRKLLADTAKKYGVDFWQTEYSMLANGYKEGAKGKISAIDCALFLAKVIHTDLTAGNATAWQFWNSYEPGSADFDTRYYLIALKPQPDFKDGEFTVTKNLWAIGNYSRFIRPGMQRVITNTSNTANADDSKLMVSCYRDGKNKLVVVAINYGTGIMSIKLDIIHQKKKYTKIMRYLTTGSQDMNMKPAAIRADAKNITLPARSISTIVME